MQAPHEQLKSVPAGRRRPLWLLLLFNAALAATLVSGLYLLRWYLDQDETGRPALSSQTIQVGSPAADFTLPGLDGSDIRLSDYRGRIVLVNFWASWCGPCRAEMPEIEHVYRTYRDAGFVAIGVNQLEPEPEVRAFIEEHQLTWIFVLDQDGAVSQRWGVLGLPQSYLIDREGRIVTSWLGLLSRQELERELQRLGLRSSCQCSPPFDRPLDPALQGERNRGHVGPLAQEREVARAIVRDHVVGEEQPAR
jgi:peroxiredoxin